MGDKNLREKDFGRCWRPMARVLIVIALTLAVWCAVVFGVPQSTPPPGGGARSVDEVLANVQEVNVAPNAFTRGEPNAPITIVVFSELLCPFCARLEPIQQQLLAKYAGKLKIVFQTFIVHGERARYAHRVAYAAGRQGKFWEVQAYILSNLNEWRNAADYESDERLDALAAQFGLDAARLRQDMKSGEVNQQIDDEIALAGRLGVNGTPCAFINGRRIRGASDFEFYCRVIDALPAGPPR
jgi:protein-disulfide isomerase